MIILRLARREEAREADQSYQDARAREAAPSEDGWWVVD